MQNLALFLMEILFNLNALKLYKVKQVIIFIKNVVISPSKKIIITNVIEKDLLFVKW